MLEHVFIVFFYGAVLLGRGYHQVHTGGTLDCTPILPKRRGSVFGTSAHVHI